jgi:LytS/YehU family sensor histidine kinase
MYLLWMNAFYGGLYVAGYLATLRTAQADRRLAEFRLARNEADILIREARVRAFRGQLPPSILWAAIAALRERYGRDSMDGDQLFDGLIAFLRVAMPSIGSGLSTLDAELETLRNYVSLRAMLPVSGPRWHLDLAPAIPALPFPSLVLLPAMHSLGSTLGERDMLTLSVAVAPDAVVLRLEANQSAQLSQQIDERLRGGLGLTFGPAAKVSEGCDLPMIIRLFPRMEAANATSFAHHLEGDRNETDGNDGDFSANSFFMHTEQ